MILVKSSESTPLSHVFCDIVSQFVIKVTDSRKVFRFSIMKTTCII